MYTSQILTRDVDLKDYQVKTFEQIGVMFPIEYLKSSFIRIFKNTVTNEIIGGFAIVLNTNLRTLDSISGKYNDKKYNESNTMEITGLWLDRDIKNGILCTKFWLHFFKDVYGQKDKDFIVYAYDLAKPKLQKLYSKGSPTILYRGKTKKLKGMETESIESIEVVARKSLLQVLFKNTHYLVKKIVFKRNRLSLRKYA